MREEYSEEDAKSRSIAQIYRPVRAYAQRRRDHLRTVNGIKHRIQSVTNPRPEKEIAHQLESGHWERSGFRAGRGEPGPPTPRSPRSPSPPPLLSSAADGPLLAPSWRKPALSYGCLPWIRNIGPARDVLAPTRVGGMLKTAHSTVHTHPHSSLTSRNCPSNKTLRMHGVALAFLAVVLRASNHHVK